jgi:uncharacterized membrane protein
VILAIFAIAYTVGAVGTFVWLVSTMSFDTVRRNFPELVLLAMLWPGILCALVHGDLPDEWRP